MSRAPLIAAISLAIGLTLFACTEQKYGPPLQSQCPAELTITLTVHVLPDGSAVTRAAAPFEQLQVEPGREALLGFATQVAGTDRHALYVTLPRGIHDYERIETWGHELLHAICGPWHADFIS